MGSPYFISYMFGWVWTSLCESLQMRKNDDNTDPNFVFLVTFKAQLIYNSIIQEGLASSINTWLKLLSESHISIHTSIIWHNALPYELLNGYHTLPLNNSNIVKILTTTSLYHTNHNNYGTALLCITYCCNNLISHKLIKIFHIHTYILAYTHKKISSLVCALQFNKYDYKVYDQVCFILQNLSLTDKSYI